jgi:hypothetical protein
MRVPHLFTFLVLCTEILVSRQVFPQQFVPHDLKSERLASEFEPPKSDQIKFYSTVNNTYLPNLVALSVLHKTQIHQPLAQNS